MEGGGGSFLAAKSWEIELMIALHKTEAEYGRIPVKERARMIAGMKLQKEWLATLQADEMSRKRNGVLQES